MPFRFFKSSKNETPREKSPKDSAPANTRPDPAPSFKSSAIRYERPPGYSSDTSSDLSVSEERATKIATQPPPANVNSAAAPSNPNSTVVPSSNRAAPNSNDSLLPDLITSGVAQHPEAAQASQAAPTTGSASNPAALPVSPAGVPITSPNPKASDRRRRRRAKIAASVLVRGGVGTVEAFQEVCSSVDVSRDGLLFTAGRARYWIGQTLDVIFPYSNQADAATPAQRAQVVRTIARPDHRHDIAIHFFSAMQQRPDTAVKANAAVAAQSMVLLVEPDPGAAASTRAILEKEGYGVVSVGTAHLALEVLKTETPALIIAEAEGEELGGRDLVLIVRKNDRLSHIPFVLINNADEVVFDNAATSQHGAIMSVVKPFQPQRLQHVVKLLAPPPSQRSAYGAHFGYTGVERTF
jgi:CheY-like chemotaxis protein